MACRTVRIFMAGLNTRADNPPSPNADIARCTSCSSAPRRKTIVVARLAERLPVHFVQQCGHLRRWREVPGDASRPGPCAITIRSARSAWLFWVRVVRPPTYAAKAAIPALIGWKQWILPPGTTCAADLLVMERHRLPPLSPREFRQPLALGHHRAKASPLVPDSIRTQTDFCDALGVALRHAAGADIGMNREFSIRTGAFRPLRE